MRIIGYANVPLPGLTLALLLLLTGCDLISSSGAVSEPTPNIDATIEAMVEQRVAERVALAPTPTATPRPTKMTTPTPTLAPIPTATPPYMGMPGFYKVNDSEGEMSLWIPEGWVEDTGYGKRVMQETAGSEFALFVKFFGGKSIPGGYEPNIFIMSGPVPTGTGLQEFVDASLSMSAQDYPNDSIVDRRLTYLAGANAERITFVDETSPAYDSGLETLQIYLLKDGSFWMLQCASGLDPERQTDREQCASALEAFQILE